MFIFLLIIVISFIIGANLADANSPGKFIGSMLVSLGVGGLVALIIAIILSGCGDKQTKTHYDYKIVDGVVIHKGKVIEPKIKIGKPRLLEKKSMANELTLINNTNWVLYLED